MRYPPEHKEQVHARIVNTAATALRRHGLTGIGIPALMKDAGLTHGGFYSHFDDRDALVAEALEAAAAQTRDHVFGEQRDATLDQAVARYTDPEHVRHPEAGCPIAALGPDALRASPAAADAIRTAAHRFLAELEHTRSGRRNARPSDDTLQLTATLLGALLMGRILGDDALPGRLARRHLRDH